MKAAKLASEKCNCWSFQCIHNEFSHSEGNTFKHGYSSAFHKEAKIHMPRPDLAQPDLQPVCTKTHKKIQSGFEY